MTYPKIEIVSSKSVYITIDGYLFYIDNSTNEQIMDCWKESTCVNCGYDYDNVEDPDCYKREQEENMLTDDSDGTNCWNNLQGDKQDGN